VKGHCVDIEFNRLKIKVCSRDWQKLQRLRWPRLLGSIVKAIVSFFLRYETKARVATAVIEMRSPALRASNVVMRRNRGFNFKSLFVRFVRLVSLKEVMF